MRNVKNKKIRNCPVDKCFLCGSGGGLLYGNVRDMIYSTSGQWNLRLCANPTCRLIWLDPSPIEEDIGKLYVDYFTHTDSLETSGSIRSGKLTRLFKFIKRVVNDATLISRERKRLNEMYLGGLPPGRLLEIGCGNGSRLALLESLGWRVTGQDPDPVAADVARRKFGLEICTKPLTEIGLPSGNFDAIIMNHVIEHVYAPLALLGECHRLLKEGGALVMVTPNSDSYGHKWFRQCWFGFDPPRHLVLFSVQNLQYMLNRAGFAIDKIFTTSVNADSIAYGSYEIINKTCNHVLCVRLILKAKSAFFLYSTNLLCLFRKHSGEECVVIARVSPSSIDPALKQ